MDNYMENYLKINELLEDIKIRENELFELN